MNLNFESHSRILLFVLHFKVKLPDAVRNEGYHSMIADIFPRKIGELHGPSGGNQWIFVEVLPWYGWTNSGVCNCSHQHANSGKEQEILDLAAAHAKPKFAGAGLTEEEMQSISQAVKDAVIDTAERMRKHAEIMGIEIMRMIFVTLKTQDAVMNAIANNVSASLPERYSPKKAEIWH